MSNKSRQAYAEDEIVQAYELLRRDGIPSDQWWMLSDRLGFKTSTTSVENATFRYRYSYYGGWSDPVSIDYPSTESVWSFNNAPFYRYINHKKRRKLSSSAFNSWADAYVDSTGIGKAFLKITDKTHIVPSHVPASVDTFQDGAVTNVVVYNPGGTSPVPPLQKQITAVDTLNGLGATAIARCAPNNPNSDLATFLGELREGLPTLPLLSVYKDRTRNLVKNAGGEYLNYEFGWQPMVSDLQNFASNVKHSKALLAQFLRDSDRKIRRSYHFPTEKTTNIYDNVTFQTGSPVTGRAFLYGGTVEDQITTKRWFSGAFRYHVPGGSSALAHMERLASEADRLLGVKITPEVLWNLTPWTWMLDWFGNVGDILHNISVLGQDSMVMQYGYMMEHKTIHRIHKCVDYYGQPVRTEFHYETKRRVPATPYGFGLNMQSITTAQAAILAALGMSRGPGAVKKPFL